MKLIDCSCNGVNPNCIKCFGRGYFTEGSIQKVDKSKKSNSKKLKGFRILRKNIEKTEIETITKRLHTLQDEIDYCSQAQQDVLNIIDSKEWHSVKAIRKQYGKISKLQNLKNMKKAEAERLIIRAKKYGALLKLDYKHPLSTEKIKIPSSKTLSFSIVHRNGHNI